MALDSATVDEGTSRLHWVDRAGVHINRETWERLVENEAYSLVAIDALDHCTEVVTRWTGIYDDELDDLPYVYVTGIQRRSGAIPELVVDSLVLATTEQDAYRTHEMMRQQRQTAWQTRASLSDA